MADSLASRRVQYETHGLDVDDLAPDPMAQWHRWYDEAVEAGCVEPNAFVLSTVDFAGQPHSRYVLARSADDRGFTFFTNLQSDKSTQLEAGGHVALLFSWLQLHRQVRVWGEVVGHVPDAESDEYYASRPRASQIGAWASPQSTPIADRDALDQRVARFTQTFAAVEDIPRPAFWGGWLIRPTQYEFWQGRPSRLHDRLRYRQGATGWEIDRLAP
jgi:pyridoxamine 5'-phosphate oxidase